MNEFKNADLQTRHSMSWRPQLWTVYFFNGYNKDRDHSWTYLFNGCSDETISRAKKMMRVFLSVHAFCLSTKDFNNGTTYIPQRLQWSLARGETGCNRVCLCIAISPVSACCGGSVCSHCSVCIC